MAQMAQMDIKIDLATNKKKENMGLKVPGSNWERYKNSISEAHVTEPLFNNVSVKRKKSYYKPRQKANLEVQEQIQTVNTEDNENETKITDDLASQLTKVVAMDCEMVGIGDGQESMLARISIVNQQGACIYDKYVKPTEEVQDYRTAVSGILPHHLQTGHDFRTVQKEVAEILKGRILVGHALHHDLAVLFLSHPKRYQRDTSRYKLFRKVTRGNTPSLKKLALELLGKDIQLGEHSSIEDARAAMQLYQLFRKKWENDLRSKR